MDAPNGTTNSVNRKEDGYGDVKMIAPRKQRERQAPAIIAEPLSPGSSSSQATSADATFEPTVDMMVNDFDDEQTLNEEEALDALELQDQQDEIATLKEESEMPLEELLAKYRTNVPSADFTNFPPRKRLKKAAKRKTPKNNENDLSGSSADVANMPMRTVEGADARSDVIVIESGDEEGGTVQKAVEDYCDEKEEPDEVPEASLLAAYDAERDNETNSGRPTEKSKLLRRSHLLDLYPEESFAALVTGGREVIPLELLYGEEDDDEAEDEEDEEETEIDYVKKTIMVGAAYQAAIPIGMSQYGDVLPYENEDKLIWEPSQVSEREVEEYLLRARDIKPTLSDEEIASGDEDATKANENCPLPKQMNAPDETISNITETASRLPSTTNSAPAASSSSEGEQGGVVKDNEQALHLLVQCGYDFKEALRRKRLNAVPLTGSMSLWSEEECHKFEEGIQKFGKDFLKIRQNQVRTRTMRELVQFYYLWKKSERRDHEFANSDTVDHMDIYLNEGEDYGPNATAAGTPGTGPATTSPAFATRKINACNQKNFSIMTGNHVGSATTPSPQSNTAITRTSSVRRRGTAAGAVSAVSLLAGTNNSEYENASTSAPVAK